MVSTRSSPDQYETVKLLFFENVLPQRWPHPAPLRPSTVSRPPKMEKTEPPSASRLPSQSRTPKRFPTCDSPRKYIFPRNPPRSTLAHFPATPTLHYHQRSPPRCLLYCQPYRRPRRRVQHS